MAAISRRQFLQSGGAAVAALGLNRSQWLRASQRYSRVLASPSHRRRALLIGIGDYPGSASGEPSQLGLWSQLKGPVNDVMLQKELLRHRYGFSEKDLVVLTDQQATRDNILSELVELIGWVRAEDDVVVVHYSGHGSTVRDPHHVFPDHVSGTIVPIDAELPSGYPHIGGEVSDISAGTIFLLREALARKTRQVSLILDSCYSGAGVRGNLVFRSRPGQVELRADRAGSHPLTSSAAELEVQRYWRDRLGMRQEEWIQRRREGAVNGVAILACSRDQRAADAAVTANFHAGVFTYALTRQLWQQSGEEGMGRVMVAVAAGTDQFLRSASIFTRQTPAIESDPAAGAGERPMFFLSPSAAAAEAVITAIQGRSAELMLCGVAPEVLETFGKGATLTMVDQTGQPRGTVVIQARDRLRARGIVQASGGFQPQAGTVLQERLRVLPPRLALRVGLDPSLGSWGDSAAAALKTLPRIEVVPVRQQEVDCILGRGIAGSRGRSGDRGLALFSVGMELIPGTERSTQDGVAAAVSSLRSRFQALLLARLLRLTLNGGTTRLKLSANLTIAGDQRRSAAIDTSGARGAARGGASAAGGGATGVSTAQQALQLPIHTPMQVSITNLEDRDLHLAVLIVSPNGDIDILFPAHSQSLSTTLASGKRLVIPTPEQISARVVLSFQPPLGLAELMILCGTQPLGSALDAIAMVAAERADPSRSEERLVQRSQGAILALLNDLAGATRGSSRQGQGPHLLDPTRMAALSMPFQIMG